MSDPTISDNRGCVWFCFGKNRHCAYCDIMGVCNAPACPYAVCDGIPVCSLGQPCKRDGGAK